MLKRTFGLSVIAGLLAATSLCRGAPEPPPAGPPAKPMLPGSFQTLMLTEPNLEAGKVPRVGRYFSPVTDAGFNPGVLVFLAGTEQPATAEGAAPAAATTPQALASLLRTLDGLVDPKGKYPNARMTGCVVWLNDGGYR